jgi:hypothetical protein
VALQIKYARELRDELRFMIVDRKEAATASTRPSLFTLVNNWIYRRCMCSLSSLSSLSLDRAHDVAAARVKQLTEERIALEQRPLEPTGKAIVVFNDEVSARNMVWEYESRLSSSLLSKIATPEMVLTFHVLTGVHVP